VVTPRHTVRVVSLHIGESARRERTSRMDEKRRGQRKAKGEMERLHYPS